MQRIAIAILVFASGIPLFGCEEADEAVDKVQDKASCSTVCNRYKDCLDSDYDVNQCTDNCEAQADTSGDKDRRLDECDSCIEDRSCSGATFNCATECGGIVVQ